MAPRKRRAENRYLPKRWQREHGAIYYRVPPGLEHLWDGKKRFRLGKDEREAHSTWYKRHGPYRGGPIRTIAELLDRYAAQVIPERAPKTRIDYLKAIPYLKAVFGMLQLEDVRPQDIYRYVAEYKPARESRTNGKIGARRHLAVLSHAYTKAVEWGVIDRHPYLGQVRLKGEKPRTRYVEDWEVVEMLSLDSRRKRGSVYMIQAYVRVKILTGLRRGDLLRLSMANLREDGIHVTTAKTGRKTVILWSPALRDAIDAAKEARPIHIGPWLFCNKRGECYVAEDSTASGWDSMWQRFMNRLLSETAITERFTEHDLRAKCASDAQTLEHARELLTHADSKITERVYRRKPKEVMPLK